MILLIPIILIEILYLVYVKTDKDWQEPGLTINTVAATGILFSSIGLVVMLFLIPFCYIGSGAQKEALETRYELLTYRYENCVSNGDIDYSERELMRDIQDWNEKVAKGKVLQNDPWIGIYYPDIWDDVEKIELRKGGC